GRALTRLRGLRRDGALGQGGIAFRTAGRPALTCAQYIHVLLVATPPCPSAPHSTCCVVPVAITIDIRGSGTGSSGCARGLRRWRCRRPARRDLCPGR